MRKILLSSVLILLPTFAFADATVSGQWEAVLDNNKAIEMDVLADGNWYSQNVEDGKVVRRLSGTYIQVKESQTKGTISFTPIKGETDNAQIETDDYILSDDRKTLSLINNGDTMEYQKQNSD